VAVDSHGNLYVSDQSNNRILEYNTPFSSGTGADRVFGQIGIFTTNRANQPGLNANSLYGPMGLALDISDNLYVADFYNNRVLKYLSPLTNTVATKVYGQAGSFTTSTCRLGGVTADSLCNPNSVAIDPSGNVYVADYNNNRVLEFNSLPSTDTTADFVFGQGNNFTTNTCNLGALTASSLCQPRAVTTTSGGNVFIADTNNHRVLKYTTPLTTDRTADRVFGQGNLFTINGCKTLGPASLCWPEGIAIDGSNNLYIVDSNNNRVLQFLNP
jgi:sugar lactone lactonase YvrE